jgi:hypothetical protein
MSGCAIIVSIVTIITAQEARVDQLLLATYLIPARIEEKINLRYASFSNRRK